MVRGRWQVVTLIVVSAGILAAAGCSPPTAAAVGKLQSGQIGALTAAEWKALAGVGTLFGAPIPPLSDEQAEAIVHFLRVNNINTFDELEAALNSGNIEVPPEVEAVFADFG